MTRRRPRGETEGLDPIVLSPAEGPAGHANILVEQVQSVGAQMRALLDMAAQNPDALKACGLTVVDVARHEFRMPSARAFVAASLGNGLAREEILALYYRGRQSIHALAPFISYMLAWKAEDARAPGSTRVLLEIAKGIGLLAPAEAVSSKTRFDNMGLDALKEQQKADPVGFKKKLLDMT